MNLFKFKQTANLAFAIATLFLVSCSKEHVNDDVLQVDKSDDVETGVLSKSSKSVKLNISSASASTSHSSYPASKAIDGSTASTSRWSGDGVGTTFIVDLGSTALIDYLKIFWYASDRTYQFKVYTSASSSGGWTLVGTKSSSATNAFEEFDITNSTGRYIRLVCNGNNVNNWNNIVEFEAWGTGDSTAPPSGSSASSILNLANWKLNAYSGTLNVNSSNNGLSYVDNASKNDNTSWFYGSNGYAYFKTYPGNPTSGGSSNPRTELREMNGSSEIYWDGTTSTERSMKWKFRIDNLPPSGKLCFGQIHEKDDSFDDIIRVQCQGSGGQTTGSIDLRILGYVTETLEGEGKTINFNFNMRTEYYFELAMKNSVVKLYELNSSGSRVQTLYTSGNVGNADENYFKAGCYLQSTSSSHSSSSVYGLVGIKTLTIN
ncbi:polysaccharide lyase family 7 protein [Mariniflexile ostreae]|uniref:Polysaccharide lyase family 7 protein n=1 Tax=Mariniflexile ostreae TaxID=1520892 RepID=A0ABV5FE30_9FLAO